MPLPTGDMAWPPPYLGPALDAMHTWDTWWSGDPDRLETLYGGSTGAAPDPKRLQYAGGVVGRIARWWWGTPTAPGERRTKLHVPIAGDLCGGSADLLFSEPPRFTVDDTTTQNRLDVLADDGMLATLQTAAELAAAQSENTGLTARLNELQAHRDEVKADNGHFAARPDAAADHGPLHQARAEASVDEPPESHIAPPAAALDWCISPREGTAVPTSPHSEQPEAIKPRPDYPPKTPPPPKRPPSPPPPDPTRSSEHAHLLDGLPVPQRAGSRPGGHRSPVLMKNRPGTSWTLENAPWVPKKAADKVADRLTTWGFTPPEQLPDIVKTLVKAVIADGGRRVSVHLSEQHGQVLVLALSHQAAVEDKGHELLAAVHDLGATSCGTETTAEGRHVWALLDLTPAPA